MGLNDVFVVDRATPEDSFNFAGTSRLPVDDPPILGEDTKIASRAAFDAIGAMRLSVTALLFRYQEFRVQRSAEQELAEQGEGFRLAHCAEIRGR